MISAQRYADAVRPVLDRLVDTQAEAIDRAADLIAAGLRRGGVLQAFGAGHSEAFAAELVARAGGLVPTNRLAQLLTAEVVRRFHQAGEVPPIYLSANVPGGDEHNLALESRYAGRLRRTA